MEHKILIVDDEPHVIAALKRTLMEEPYEIHSALTGEEGLKILRKERVKVVISDEKMPGMAGAEFLALVRERYPDAVRIILTGHASIDATMKAVNRGEIYRFFTKPWNDTELHLAIRSAVEKFDLEAENRRLLQTVKRQAVELKLIEHRYPGITLLERDILGNIVLPEISEEEYAEIVQACDQEFP